ncbi:MAG: MFS transporter, partial [Candidatus Cryptobacteroides sp.]|nr:MFS transporter [Candidatus Cryptobacteroides sp.]
MFKGQPKGLFALALANTGERFGYYTMLAIFMLFLQAKFGWSQALSSQVYSIFLALVYFMPVVGGILADKIGYGKCVVTGICVMFAGYLALAIPTGANALGITLMLGALLLISVGTGLFKGNLQVLVGNLYDDPKYSAKRDSAFSLFYMAINIGAMFAPSAATAITNSFLGKAGLIYKAAIPQLAHQTLEGVITPENASRLSELQAQMPDAAVAG